MWTHGLRGGMNTDLTAHLPDIDEGDRFRFVGLGTGDFLQAEASESPVVRLTRPLPRDAGLLVSVEVAPVFRRGPTAGEEELRFQPLRTVALVPSGQPLLEAAARFQKKNIAAINEAVGNGFAPPLPPAIEHPDYLYDARRDRVMVCNHVYERRVLTRLCYAFQSDGSTKIESLLLGVMENPR
jgi:hypothetical protein